MKPFLKEVTLCASSLICICSFAQDNFYVSKMDDVFFNLDKSAVTTGILYDRTYSFSELQAYNRAADTSESSWLEQAYFELYNAAYSKSAFLGLSDFADIIDIEKLKGRVPIAVIDYSMHYIRSTAISENLIYYQNEHLYDVQGRQSSPYNFTRIQMASPMTDSAHTGWVRFSLPDLLSLGNGITVQSAILSFPQGTITILPNAMDSIYFSGTGRQTGTITVNYTNGQQFSQKMAFYTTNTNGGAGMPAGRMTGGLSPEDDACYSESVKSNIAFQGYDEVQVYYGWNTVNYYYRTNASFDCNVKQKRTLGKPVIVLDGFDPTNKRAAKTIKDEAFLYFNPNTSRNEDLSEQLRSQGYDIIIVNHPDYIEGTKVIQTPFGGTRTIDRLIRGGGDYIERNAMVLVKIIQDINDQLANQGSTEKIVVVGPSMGGQISRYALRYMKLMA